jgi:putative NIF3 family GTP cyclohydrolase 1 type 2
MKGTAHPCKNFPCVKAATMNIIMWQTGDFFHKPIHAQNCGVDAFVSGKMLHQFYPIILKDVLLYMSNNFLSREKFLP